MTRPARGPRRGLLLATAAAAAALLLAGTSPTNAAARPALGGPAVATDASTPAWLRYDRPATYEIATEEIRVPLRDGVGMRCTLERPARAGVVEPGPYPAVVTNFFAYRAFQQTAMKSQADGPTARGYATLACSPRGSGGTPGVWRPFTAQDSRDLYDLIEWAGEASWSNGRVGQTGISYGGITTYKAAAAAPPHLAAVAPIVAYSDVYSEMVYPGGIRGMPLRWWPALTWATSLPDQPGLDGPAALPGYVGFEAEAQAHPTRDAFWKELAIDTAALDKGNVPVLGIGGWHDLFAAGMVANYLAAKDQSRLLMLPWAHGDFVPGAPDFAIVDHALLAWFDHHLMRLPGAPLPSAKVTSWELPRTVGHFVELLGLARVAPGRTRPPRDGRHAGPQAGPAGPTRHTRSTPSTTGAPVWSTASIPPPTTSTTTSGRPICAGCTSTAPRSAGTSSSPAAPSRASAPRSSAADANLVVRLEDVAPDATSQVITTGWLRASHRVGHDRVVALTPGRIYDYDIPLWPTHWRLRAGHLLRVTVSSGDLAMIEPNAPAGTVTVLTGGAGGSRIDVPTGTTGR